jgi:pilus assembly protein CpaF
VRLTEKLAGTLPGEADEAPIHVERLNARRRVPKADLPGVASWEASKRKVRQLVLADMTPKMAHLPVDALAGEIRETLDVILERNDVTISPLERRKFVEEIIQDTLGYGPLDPLLRDPSVTEIMCNAFNEIWVERAGVLEMVDARFGDDDQYRRVIDRIVAGVGRRLDEASPMVDARLSDGSRVNAIIPPLAIHAPVLTIRKFAAQALEIKDLINLGTLTLDASVVLEACVRGKLNLLVSGGTGSGKTTLLNVLSSFIPEGERIITIEDAAELQLQQPHVVSLEVRPPNIEGVGEVLARDLVRNSLRMRPDRVIVGECRGAEALDMLQAMNTGHEGSMSTAHANNPRDALSRLETMVLMAGFDLPLRAVREQIVSALDVIVHMERGHDGRRVVTAISEIQGLEGDVVLLQEVFTNRLGDGRGEPRLVATGLRPRFADYLEQRGIHLPASVFRAQPPAESPRRLTSEATRPAAARMPSAAAIAVRGRQQ